ncbi:phosphatase 2C [Diaporthe eres]|nr:phosphatase 2C [Diaporthe eres]
MGVATTRRLRDLSADRQETKAGRGLSIFAARLLSSGTQNTLLHDHIYRILGLVEDFQASQLDAQLEFQVDYQQSVKQVYFMLQRFRCSARTTSALCASYKVKREKPWSSNKEKQARGMQAQQTFS